MFSRITQSVLILLALLLIATASQLQGVLERLQLRSTNEQEAFFLPSGRLLKKISMGHEGILADLYWMSTVQYYGGQRLKHSSDFKLLFPLLDTATTLDPQLLGAYRFGSTFVAERSPIGGGQPQLAIALIKKGIENNPGQWQLYRDLGFVYYWYLNDYHNAAAAFLDGARNPKSAKWMKFFAAELLNEGGSREKARFLWRQIIDSSEDKDIQENARENLLRLQAEEEMETLQSLIARVERKTGQKIHAWSDLVSLHILPATPTDPKGFPYILDSQTGKAGLSPDSTIRR